jgi:RNA polymerase sigma factor (sigma-70 family)
MSSFCLCEHFDDRGELVSRAAFERGARLSTSADWELLMRMSPSSTSTYADPLVDDALLARITRLARRYAMVIVDDRDVAKDIAQNVVIDYLIKARSGRRRIRLSSLRSHVQKIVNRRAVDWLRRSQRRADREAMFAHEVNDGTHAWMAPDLASEDRNLNQFLVEAVASLPDACRASYVMVREGNASYAAVAERLGVSRSAVTANVVRAHRALRARLLERGINAPRARGNP